MASMISTCKARGETVERNRKVIDGNGTVGLKVRQERTESRLVALEGKGKFMKPIYQKLISWAIIGIIGAAIVMYNNHVIETALAK